MVKNFVLPTDVPLVSFCYNTKSERHEDGDDACGRTEEASKDKRTRRWGGGRRKEQLYVVGRRALSIDGGLEEEDRGGWVAAVGFQGEEGRPKGGREGGRKGGREENKEGRKEDRWGGALCSHMAMWRFLPQKALYGSYGAGSGGYGMDQVVGRGTWCWVRAREGLTARATEVVFQDGFWAPITHLTSRQAVSQKSSAFPALPV